MADKHEVTFLWPHTEPTSVIVTGTFDRWLRTIRLTKGPKGFEGSTRVPWGEKVAYKFVVDGIWMIQEGHPTEPDHDGNVNNIYMAPPKPPSSSHDSTSTVSSTNTTPTPVVDSAQALGRSKDNTSAGLWTNFADTVAAREGTSSALGYVVSGLGAAMHSVVGVDPVNPDKIAFLPSEPNTKLEFSQEDVSPTHEPGPSPVVPDTPLTIIPVNDAENNTAAPVSSSPSPHSHSTIAGAPPFPPEPETSASLALSSSEESHTPQEVSTHAVIVTGSSAPVVGEIRGQTVTPIPNAPPSQGELENIPSNPSSSGAALNPEEPLSPGVSTHTSAKPDENGIHVNGTKGEPLSDAEITEPEEFIFIDLPREPVPSAPTALELVGNHNILLQSEKVATESTVAMEEADVSMDEVPSSDSAAPLTSGLVDRHDTLLEPEKITTEPVMADKVTGEVDIDEASRSELVPPASESDSKYDTLLESEKVTTEPVINEGTREADISVDEIPVEPAVHPASGSDNEHDTLPGSEKATTEPIVAVEVTREADILPVEPVIPPASGSDDEHDTLPESEKVITEPVVVVEATREADIPTNNLLGSESVAPPASESDDEHDTLRESENLITKPVVVAEVTREANILTEETLRSEPASGSDDENDTSPEPEEVTTKSAVAVEVTGETDLSMDKVPRSEPIVPPALGWDDEHDGLLESEKATTEAIAKITPQDSSTDQVSNSGISSEPVDEYIIPTEPVVAPEATQSRSQDISTDKTPSSVLEVPPASKPVHEHYIPLEPEKISTEPVLVTKTAEETISTEGLPNSESVVSLVSDSDDQHDVLMESEKVATKPVVTIESVGATAQDTLKDDGSSPSSVASPASELVHEYNIPVEPVKTATESGVDIETAEQARPWDTPKDEVEDEVPVSKLSVTATTSPPEVPDAELAAQEKNIPLPTADSAAIVPSLEPPSVANDDLRTQSGVPDPVATGSDIISTTVPPVIIESVDVTPPTDVALEPVVEQASDFSAKDKNEKPQSNRHSVLPAAPTIEEEKKSIRSAPTTPTKPARYSFPHGSPNDSPSSSRTGTASTRKKRTSFFGKVKQLFTHDKEREKEKEKEKERK